MATFKFRTRNGKLHHAVQLDIAGHDDTREYFGIYYAETWLVWGELKARHVYVPTIVDNPERSVSIEIRTRGGKGPRRVIAGTIIEVPEEVEA